MRTRIETNVNAVLSLGVKQCCGAVNVASGSGSAEPVIFFITDSFL
jgi:hypothetical protein